MGSTDAQAGPSVPRPGPAPAADTASRKPKRRWPQTEQEAAQEASRAISAGQRARHEADGQTGAQVASDEPPTPTQPIGMEGVAAKDAGASIQQQATAMSASPQPAHALEVAMDHISQGDEMAASRVPLRLSAIRIEGAKSMRPSFLSRICRPYIDQSLQDNNLNRSLYAHRLDHIMPGQQANLPALLALLQSVGTDLAALDMFADMNASLAPARIAELSSSAVPKGPSFEDVDIVLQCRERPRYYIKTSTDVGNGEGNATVQAKIRNIFGGAESADLAATMGTRTRRAYNASLSWPIFGYADHMATLGAFAQDRDLTAFASATEGIRGLRASLRFNDARGGLHELAYDLAHRHIGRLLPTASLSMRRLAGHSIKSSVIHTYTRDTRSDPFIASTGSLLKVMQEYAGLGGDASHYRIEGETQYSRPFFGPGDGLSQAAVVERPDEFRGGYGYSLAARAGLLATLNGRAPAFSDRFQLGGPTCVRMFRYNSLGPKDGLDSLGGDAYYSLGASLFAPPWPGKAHWPIKLHAFLDAGQLVQLQQHTNAHDEKSSRLSRNLNILADDLLSKPSASAGVGIMFRQGNLRAELNVGVPLAIRRGDGARTGVQLGIGLSFL